MEHREIPVEAIDPNPHRDLNRNPIKPEQVERLVSSIGRTGFWDNIVVRPHPVSKGRYQLAYGHNRIEAVRQAGIQKIMLPIADLGDLDMYDTMVDENETQQTITPEIAFENVESCLTMLERTFEAIGPTGTEKDFYSRLGRVVDASTTRLNDHGFEQVRARYLKSKDFGSSFVQRFVRSERIDRNNINEIIKAHYAERQQQEAEQAEAEAEEAEAEAEQAEDATEAEKKKEAARKKREAAIAKRKLAEEIAGNAILPKILMAFKTQRQMTDFAAAIRKTGIPPSHHKRAMEHVKAIKVYGTAMAEKLSLWWYEASGKAENDRKKRQAEEAWKTWNRRYKHGDYGSYLLAITSDIRKAKTAIDKATDQNVGRYCPIDPRLRNAICKDLESLISTAQSLIYDLHHQEVEHTEDIVLNVPLAIGANGATKA